MKMRIDAEQLQELTDSQKIRLREWWKPRTGDLCYRTETDWYAEHYDYGIIIDNIVHDVPSGDFSPWERLKNVYTPLLSIGQMIELLQDQFLRIVIGTDMQTIAFGESNTNIHSPELCDALWEAVKQILKEAPTE